MEVRNEIALRIDKIREIFQHITAICTEQDDLKLLMTYLENTENEFRSVAYEALAMTLARKDISNGHALNNWRAFMEGPGKNHTAQIHVGLGWAIAQQRAEVLPIINTLAPIMRFRVLDGYGFYDGTFRQRKTIMTPIIPDEIESKFLPGYDQGLGRSLWYTCKGDGEKISGMIRAFSSSRHEDLWRGVGIACVYVGGFDENILKDLLTFSSDSQEQLPVSAALVSRTRNHANALTPYTELACRIWCNRTAEEAIQVTANAEGSIAAHSDSAYVTWLLNIREELVAAKIN
jgi:hypothetical protein